MNRRTGLVAALDLPDRGRALELAHQVQGFADAFKVNYPLVLRAGLPVVRELAALLPTICDFKVADIPEIDASIVEAAFEQGAAGVIVHGFTGEDSLRACIDAARGDVFVVAEMSHPGGARFLGPVAEEIASLAMRLGASGIVAPATRPERVRRLRGVVGRGLILAPGVGAQGGSAAAAIANGADFVIVGRGLYLSHNPREAARSLAEEIASVPWPFAP